MPYFKATPEQVVQLITATAKIISRDGSCASHSFAQRIFDLARKDEEVFGWLIKLSETRRTSRGYVFLLEDLHDALDDYRNDTPQEAKRRSVIHRVTGTAEDPEFVCGLELGVSVPAGDTWGHSDHPWDPTRRGQHRPCLVCWNLAPSMPLDRR